jgi:uncharacterized protein (DUF2336 family)
VSHDLKRRLTQAAQEQLSRDEILGILEERNQADQHELAQQTDAGADVLGYLAQHGGTSTRRAVAANIAAPPQVNRILSDDVDDEVRSELCRKIARLMPDLSSREAAELRDHVIELMEKLARDQAPRVRAILADEIKHLDCVPATVVHILARDVEHIVAAPILEYSPLLSDLDLIEIVAGAQAEQVLQAVARRQPLSPEVSDAVVGTLDVSAMAALLANPEAQIRRKTLQSLAESVESMTAVEQPVALRTDLSARTMRRLASFVGTALLDTLSTWRGLDDDTRTALGRRLRERLKRDDVSQFSTPAAERDVISVLADGKMDEDTLDELAESGNRDAIVAGLATMADVPAPIVRRIIDSRSAKAVIALVWKARLSMRLAFKIQNFVMRLGAAERIPARHGKDFPLTEDEMIWQLNYFDVPLP